MAASLAIGLRTAFTVLGCVMAATVIYTLATDGLPFRKELLTPWMAATLVDFYINILAIWAWIVYKESNWFLRIVWLVLLICFGSITACAYIVMQFLKLSSQESQQDPIYFVLLRNKKKDGVEPKSILSVASAKVLFGVLGCVMLGTLIYTCVTDGSPFRSELLTPWLSATLVDFYINVVVLSVWVAYKESSWAAATFWIILLICFGSISTCAYIVLQLFRLSSQGPVFLVLFSSSSSVGMRTCFGVILAWKLRLVRDGVLGPPVNLSLLQKWQSNAHNVSDDLFVRILVSINLLYDLFLGSADELVSLLNKTFSEFAEDCFLPPSWKNVSCPEWPCTRKERAFRFRALFLREEAG